MRSPKKVAVIGGGSLGTLIALRLSSLEIDVDIYETKSELLKGASYLGEGKIHLGYTYGLSEESTYKQLIESALNFADVIESSICRPIDWKAITSVPFTYTVAQDSLINSDQFMLHATKIIKALKKDEKGRLYLGEPIESVANINRISEDNLLTQERAVDIYQLGKLINEEVSKRENISVNLNSEISLINSKISKKYILTTKQGLISNEFDYVINCTWENRHHLDKFFWKTLPDLNYRTKLYVSAQTNLREVAQTTILGKYGDLVVFNTGRLYASDYLKGLTSFSNGIYPSFTEREELPEELVTKHWNYLKTRYSAVMPELKSISEIQSFERTVVAQGDLDIDQINSGLHERPPYYVERKENYISALATKITTVPQLSKKIVDWIASDELK